MGGAVQLCIRDISGKVYSNIIHTSNLEPFFNNIRFYRADPFHLHEFLVGEQYFQLHSEQQQGCAPAGYGMVFGDFITNTVHSMQGYTTVCRFRRYGQYLPPHTHLFDDVLEMKRFEELYNEGMISTMNTLRFDKKERIDNIIDISDRTPDEVIDIAIKSGEIFTFYPIDSEFKYIKYDDATTEGMTDLKNRLMTDGIKFSKEEDKYWQSEYDRRFKSEQEDFDCLQR